MVLRAGGAGRADLRGLLPEARRPQRELTLPLQVGRLLVERPDDEHVAVEALEVGIRQRVDDARDTARRRGSARGSRRPRARGRVGARGRPRQDRFSRRSHRSTLARAPDGPLGGPSQRMPRSVGPSRQSPPRPQQIRRPSPAKGRTMRPAASNAAAIASVSAPAGSQTKLPCASGTRHPLARRPAASRSRRSAIVAHPLEQLRLGVEARERRLFGVRGDRERDAGAAGGVEDARVADRIADAQPCEPERLRERAQDDDVRAALRRRARRRPSTDVGVGHELGICLIENDRARRTARQSTNSSNSACVTIGPVGLFGLHTMIARVRSVIAAAIAGRSCRASAVSGTCTGVAPGDDGEPGIRLERSPREDDLIAGSGGREHQLREDRHAARRRCGPSRSSTPKRSARRCRRRAAVASG